MTMATDLERQAWSPQVLQQQMVSSETLAASQLIDQMAEAAQSMVGAVPTLIDPISSQINLLSLNAATEKQSAVTNDIANNVTMVSELVNGRR